MLDSTYRIDFDFPTEAAGDVEKMIEIESLLCDRLEYGRVQGHEVGAGVGVLSLVTDEPADCFQESLRILQAAALCPKGAHLIRLDSKQSVLPPADISDWLRN